VGLDPVGAAHGAEERVEAVVDTRAYDPSRFLVIVTAHGVVKKTRLSDYESRNQVLIAVRLNEGDEVVEVLNTEGNNDVLLFTAAGSGIRFPEAEMRPWAATPSGCGAFACGPRTGWCRPPATPTAR